MKIIYKSQVKNPKLGFYEVGKDIFYNKVEALEAATRLKIPFESVHWNFNDEVFKRIDWTQEPDLALTSLYEARARQLREKYDYIVLHYSAGSDSHNILKTFIKNNIYLDEILTRGSYSAVNKKEGVTTANDQYGECLVQGIPLAQWVKDNHMPHVKITLVDTVEIINNFYAKNPNWVEDNPWAHTPSAILKVNPDLLSPHYGELHERGRKVAHIIGSEKPVIFRKNNYFYTHFKDKTFQEFIENKYRIAAGNIMSSDIDETFDVETMNGVE